MSDCIAIVSDLIFASRITGTAATAGVACTVVRTKQELERALAAESPALVLVDMNAEGLVVDAAITAVKTHYPGSRVVAFFSHVHTELKCRAETAGANEVLPRSVFVERLSDLLSGARPADDRLRQAVEQIDAANREDPRTELVEGEQQPRELLFSRRVCAWVERLADRPSEALRLAARAHTIRRWRIPRDQYPKTNEGYHAWRSALADFHARETETILSDVGYDRGLIDRVTALITRANWPADREAKVLEDADCLVFLETKLQRYVDEWGEDKTVRILRSTVAKMTPEGKEFAQQLPLGEKVRRLVEQAMS